MGGLHKWSCQESYSASETAGEYIFINTDRKNCLPHTDTFTSYILNRIYRVWIQIYPHKMSMVKLVHLESGGTEVSIRSFQGVELRSPVTVFYDTLLFIFQLYRQGKKNSTPVVLNW